MKGVLLMRKLAKMRLLASLFPGVLGEHIDPI